MENQTPEPAFNYSEALKELEQIAQKAEDPETGLDQIDKYISRSKVLIEKCREYLRTAREKIAQL